jgi:hypothetical protein
MSEPRINEAARAELEEMRADLWDTDIERHDVARALDSFLRSRALPVEGEREDRLHDGSCDYCGAVPTLPRHICVGCWEILGRRP